MSKILVADDLADAAEDLAELFNAMGHETRVAFDGRQAVDAARAFSPHITLLDLDMPVLDGYEAARAIRSDGGLAQPFLVALTASTGTAVEVATQAVGFDFYLRKPADTNALLALISDLSTRSR